MFSYREKVEISNQALQVKELLNENKISFSISYTGETEKDDNWECDSFIVLFTKAGQSISFPYYTGLGHRLAVERFRKPIIPKQAIGYYEGLRRVFFTTDKEVSKKGKKYQLYAVIPEIAGIIYSLLSDSTCLDMCFLDWCDELDYSQDSIKAQNLYNDCCRSSQQFRSFFNHALRQQLQTILEDY